MSNIITKLNLNKTPNLVEDNSLVFAKNIRLDADKTIHKDWSVMPLSLIKQDDYYVDYEDIFNKILADVSPVNIDCRYKLESLLTAATNGNTNKTLAKIVGCIPSSNEYFLFINNLDENIIIEYDEKAKKFKPCLANWNWSGGKISGNLVNNLSGDRILNICESFDNSEKLVPLKSINISRSSYNDEESIYTQVPKIPITNLNATSSFRFTIPNGVYQFFVRYKISENTYTNWFLASKELFAGNSNSQDTNFGTLKYHNSHRDSDISFVLSVEHLYVDSFSHFKSFQIGFILTHDDTNYARAWKHFDFDTTTIYFDYNALDSEEIEVTDLTEVVFGIYNVGNITNFKNKLYISNYTETNFNDESLQEVADRINITLAEKESNLSVQGYTAETTQHDDQNFISAINYNDETLSVQSIVSNIINNVQPASNKSNVDNLKECITPNNTAEHLKNYSLSHYGIRVLFENVDIDEAIEKNVIEPFKKNEIHWNNRDYDSVKVKSINITSATVDEFPINSTNYANIAQAAYAKCIELAKYIGEDKLLYDSSFQIRYPIQIKLQYSITLTVNRIENGQVVNHIERTFTETIIPQISVYSDIAEIKPSYDNTLLNLSTLIPYQEYKFYIHFVKNTGETTNGYFCKNAGVDGVITVDYKENANKIIYPVFSNITDIPNDYVAYFFTILHSGKTVSTVFDLAQNTRATDIYGHPTINGSCIELNTRLVSQVTNLTILQENKEVKGKFYYSSDASRGIYFGANGIVSVENVENSLLPLDLNKLAYLINDYYSNADDVQLIKCTPYITATTQIVGTKHWQYMNLGGYICIVSPLDRNQTIKYYSDGNNIYKKIVAGLNTTTPGEIFLHELFKYTDTDIPLDEHLSQFGMLQSNSYQIYSNYNLNFLQLTDDVTPRILTYYNYDSDAYNNTESTDANAPSNPTSASVQRGVTRQYYVFKSLILSDIYELASMYREYVRKTFYKYNKNELIRFDNTVRSSEISGDESRSNLFKFRADQYYNVPVNRGTITNLVAIGDGILVHTKDSMFKFSGSNIIQSNEGEIQQIESTPFETGVTELFGSEFGFAGLQNKNHQIVTEAGYIFYDSDSKIIYIYGGNSQITKISDSVEKLLRRKEVVDINFANDFYNNRFFVCVYFEDNTSATLSYVLLDDLKSFVSLHDFAFKESFNTKTKCYFITDDKDDICAIDKTTTGFYRKLETNFDRIYPKMNGILSVGIKSHREQGNEQIQQINFRNYSSLIDVICNSNYETIKTLNNIEWVSNYVVSEFANIPVGSPYNVSEYTKMADVQTSLIPCGKLMIYSDTCFTKIISFGSDISNNISILDPNSYKYPRYNQGKWSYNYFRDIENTEDVYKYLPQYDDGRAGASYRSDNNSLIEGKYFVVRYYFDDDFKLETLTFDYINKL